MKKLVKKKSSKVKVIRPKKPIPMPADSVIPVTEPLPELPLYVKDEDTQHGMMATYVILGAAGLIIIAALIMGYGH